MDSRTLAYAFSIILLIVASGFFYYSITGSVIQEETLKVTKAIDGDTLELENGQRVRLLGVNTPEKKVPFNEEATAFLKELENKTVFVEDYGIDKYGRTLGHIFFNNQHINEEILKKGLGTLYYYERDSYYDSLRNAEEYARNNQKGLWKKSQNSKCLELIELKYAEEPERCKNDERLVIKNLCDKKVQFMFKDDATHIYYEIIESESTLTKKFSCIFNDAGDSLYVFDQEGMLLFYRYP